MVVPQTSPTLWDPMVSSPPEFSVHGILQARTLEWVATSFSRGSSWPRDWTQSPALQADFLVSEPAGKPQSAHGQSKWRTGKSLGHTLGYPVLRLWRYCSGVTVVMTVSPEPRAASGSQLSFWQLSLKMPLWAPFHQSLLWDVLVPDSHLPLSCFILSFWWSTSSVVS